MQQELMIKPEMMQIDVDMIDSQPSFRKSIVLCKDMSGLEDKKFVGPKEIVSDKSEWSRIIGGQHNFPLEKIGLFMDLCRNEVPLIWLARRRGYELRPLESKLERELRIEREQNEELSKENALLRWRAEIKRVLSREVV